MTRLPTADYAVSRQQCDALFAAILVHDTIDLAARAPDAIHLNYTQDQLAHCYAISRQLWTDGVEHAAFARLLHTLRSERRLCPEDQLYFKHVRAKFKHLRAAFAAYDQQHRYPRLFHWLISIMGYLQDALKSEQTEAVRRFATLLGLLWSNPVLQFVSRKIDYFRPCTPASFRDYVLREMHFVAEQIKAPGVSGKVFHDTRKVISRQVAIYDNLNILYPSAYHRRVSAYINTLNGLMGNMHDDLVVKKIEKTQNYRADRFPIPEPINERLIALLACYGQVEAEGQTGQR